LLHLLPLKWGHECSFSSQQFKSFLEEIYTRRASGEHLENIRNDNFDVSVATSRGYDVVLPSLWDEVIVPEAHIRIAFWSDDNVNAGARLRRSYSSKDRTVEFADIEVDVSEDEWASNVPLQRRRTETDDLFRPPPPPPRERPRLSTGTHSDRMSDEEDSTSEEEEEEEDEELTDEDREGSEPLPEPEPVRVPITPTDQDGNELAFTIGPGWIGPHSHAGKEPEISSDITKQSRHKMEPENLRITKALTVTTEDRTAVQVHTLPGPENSVYSSSVGVRWHHIHAELLDWAQFKVRPHLYVPTTKLTCW
jgi:hypothetical protein